MSTLEDNVSANVEQWRAVVGPDNVVTTPDELRTTEEATFATNQRIPAIVRPENTEQVRECIQVANNNRAAIYPVSRGQNWGFGSRVPVRTGCCVLDLSRMDRIIDFNDELGYITVEPGVTFRQVAEFLAERKAKHFLPTIGGPPDSSLIGNYAERGTGCGPMGDRAQNACAAEVVLGRGDVIRTGFAQFPNSALTPLHRCGVGPSLDGLFNQSNFGIITQLTLWLCKQPAYFQSFYFTANTESNFDLIVDQLRELQKQRVIIPHCLGLWDRYKFAAAQRQHPAPETGSLDIDRMNAGIGKSFRNLRWLGFGGLFAASRKLGMAQRKLVKQSIRRHCGKLVFVDSRRYRLMSSANRIARALRLPPVVSEEILDNLYTRSIFLGHPTEQSISSIYWRKRQPVPADKDPHRDACGIIWMSHAVPFRAADVRRAVDFATDSILKAGFEPNIAMVNVADRHLRLLIVLFCDRTVTGDDEKARDCHDRVFTGLNEMGYTTFRLGIQSMDLVPKPSDENAQLVAALKAVLDPNNVVAPGRYAFTGF